MSLISDVGQRVWRRPDSAVMVLFGGVPSQTTAPGPADQIVSGLLETTMPDRPILADQAYERWHCGAENATHAVRSTVGMLNARTCQERR
ncbi:hypothetical protein [Nocardia sp. R6R-6]|uniref:hypothetical protein n=1 Tax=Nocardia sp. R6R-6 TaxID=3459303 RepID=UPI00403D5E3A